MICPKCGTEIQDGYLYCSKCGEEIKIVPDFEVELEEGIEQTISEVAEIIADSVVETTEAEEDDISVPVPVVDENKKVKKNIKKNIGPGILIAVAVILGLLFVFGIYRLVTYVDSYYSFDIQYAKAQDEYTSGDYEAAIKTAKHVISLKKEKEPRMLLAESYYALDKYDESIAVLNDLLNDYPQDKTIYERLLEAYETEGDTDSIIRLAEKTSDEGILEMFGDYFSDEPQFSLESGTYYEPQLLELTHEGEGIIRFTIDGTEATGESQVYMTPIILEEGETTVSALYENEKGVVSKSVSRTYNIETIQAALPRLITQGGDFSVPRLIVAEEPVEGKLYYTCDGTDPTEKSTEYEPPVLMPLGKSEFRFVLINDAGVLSDVVTAEYNLKIDGAVDIANAQSLVQLKLVSLGHPVMDHDFRAVSGYFHDGRSYYVVEEYAGGQKQNTVYAVDSMTGEVFTITINKSKGDCDFGMVM